MNTILNLSFTSSPESKYTWNAKELYGLKFYFENIHFHYITIEY